MGTKTSLTEYDFEPEASEYFYAWMAIFEHANHLYSESDDQDEIELAFQMEMDSWKNLRQFKIND